MAQPPTRLPGVAHGPPWLGSTPLNTCITSGSRTRSAKPTGVLVAGAARSCCGHRPAGGLADGLICGRRPSAGLADCHVCGRRPSAGLADGHVCGRRPSAGLADARTGSARVVGVFEQDDVRLRARLADARDVDGGLVDVGQTFSHAPQPMQSDGSTCGRCSLHASASSACSPSWPGLAVALRDLDLFDPDRLRRRRAELLADDARRRHRPGQAAALIVERGADR